ncbi:hypothetical protein JCM11251_001591 [Rhodosporidiobolus azoricus]
MIPARTKAEEPPPRISGVSERLQRLRLEQRASERPSFRSGTPTRASSNTPRWVEGALRPQATSVASLSTRYHGRRGLAGPAAPPSWTEIRAEPTLVDGRAQHGIWQQPLERVSREKLAAPLHGGEKQRQGVKSLFFAAGGVVAQDLAKGWDGSMLLEHVAYLPNHLRLRLLDVFAEVDNKAWLTSEGAVELLRTDLSDGYERTFRTEESDKGMREAEEEDWEAAVLGGEGTSLFDLTSLNFSFSLVSLRTLRQLLLRPAVAAATTADLPISSRPATPSTALASNPLAPKLLPTFPLLHTLNLTSTTRIPFSDSFFDLLSHLISLRTLSLCGKTLSSSGSAITASTFLPRLATSTPTLIELDLSHIDLAHVNVQSVDWDERWLQLKVLGLRRELIDFKGEEVKPEKKDRIKKEVWTLISQGRTKKRRWIEIIV